MISILLLILPLVAALLSLVGPKQSAGRFASILSFASLALGLYAYYEFTAHGAGTFNFNQVWIKNPAINLNFTVDGIAILLIVMTNICMPFIHLSANNRDLKEPRIYHFLISMMHFALIGVFLSNDLLLYYIFWELTIIPAYFMLLHWGGRNRKRITFKFFLYTVFGSLLMMVSIIYLYANYAKGGAIDSVSIFNMNVDIDAQNWIFIGFMMAFAVKLPLIPFHTWQANTYHMAPTQGTMILSGLLAKMALFSIVRWMMPGLPAATTYFAPYILMMAVLGVIYAGVIAIMQKDMKKLFAYVSLAHISLMVAGLFSLSISGIQGAFTQAFSHGFNTVALFICADIIQNRVGTTDLTKLGGIRKIAPKFTTAFFIVMFATAAIPFSNSFIGELVTLYGVFQYSAVWSLVAAFSLVLGAIFMLRMFRQAVLGPDNTLTAGFRDLNGSEKMSIYPFVILIFVFGLVYQPIFDLVDDSTINLINQVVPKPPMP
jgi:NADH-quinone oxidoreductase subunit M